VVSADTDGIVVRCGDGAHLVVTELQRAGGKRLPAREFLQGFPVAPGERFVPPVA
jgi:methionyl-tRNA formyltransferase